MTGLLVRLGRRPKLSVVVIVYDMQREAPRTLQSLATPYQRDISPQEYEVVVMENGSPNPLGEKLVRSFGPQFRYHYLNAGSKSPAAAINRGVELSRAESVGIYIDGARIASPGLLAMALKGLRLHDDSIVATLAWHLGPDVQQKSVLQGYSREVEDKLLGQIGWPDDGYRLFEISTLGQSSGQGYFVPPAESTAVFLRRATFRQLHGFETALEQPGGGVINRDFFTRAMERRESMYVMLLGEGTFHQIHGGASTGPAQQSHQLNIKWEDEYLQLRGKPLERPRRDAVYLGTIPPASRNILCLSADQVRNALNPGT